MVRNIKKQMQEVEDKTRKLLIELEETYIEKWDLQQELLLEQSKQLDCKNNGGGGMDRIYGIFTGDYSEWQCMGFYEEELDAEKHCTFDQECYILEIKNLNDTVDLSKVSPKYKYIFNEDFKDMWCNQHVDVASDGEQTEVVLRCGQVFIYVVTHLKDHDHAVKIARDVYAKWKEEHADILDRMEG